MPRFRVLRLGAARGFRPARVTACKCICCVSEHRRLAPTNCRASFGGTEEAVENLQLGTRAANRQYYVDQQEGGSVSRITWRCWNVATNVCAITRAHAEVRHAERNRACADNRFGCRRFITDLCD